MTQILNTEDLRRLARRRVPRAIFDYADGGAYEERTLNRNVADLDAIQFRQRVMVDVSNVTTATTLLGAPATMPLAIAPTGLAGLFCADGEILGARAAAAFGVPFCLSTMSICSLEDVRKATRQPFWFQQYLMRDRGFNQELIDRARAAECSALVLTLDLQVQGERRRDARNGLTVPPRLNLQNALNIASKPAWALSVLLGKRHSFGNLQGRIGSKSGIRTLAEWIATQFDPSATWRDVDWVRSRWPGKLVLKGVLDADDARLALASGADAIVVSNHGGRQLDGAPSTISVLPEIVGAIEGRCEVLLDGGIRSGQDVLKALALGARGCLIGKTFLYALAAMGEQGVTRVLGIIRDELRVSLALTGCADATKVDSRVLRE
ncbi:MAG: alpha-hydroxy acid oxidase [Phycisphaerae bacterium]|nr:alpha-hydroxy acid oxidase [Phycisphaerae bacterium]MDZ4780264.1 alpha-hydroxy acid oxidase [Planctomycetia bacterium]